MEHRTEILTYKYEILVNISCNFQGRHNKQHRWWKPEQFSNTWLIRPRHIKPTVAQCWVIIRCVPIQRLHPSKTASEDQMCHKRASKTVPFQRLLQMQPWNASFDSRAMQDTTNGSFAAQDSLCTGYNRIFFFWVKCKITVSNGLLAFNVLK